MVDDPHMVNRTRWLEERIAKLEQGDSKDDFAILEDRISRIERMMFMSDEERRGELRSEYRTRTNERRAKWRKEKSA